MTTNQGPNVIPSAPDDLPPPYSAVVGNPAQYGFVVPSNAGEGFSHPSATFTQPKSFTAPGVYPHPPPMTAQPENHSMPPLASSAVPVAIVAPAVGTEPTSITCFNCRKVVTTRVTYTTAWHTHLVAGSVCVITMVCSLCCLGLVPYCFDTFKDAEHYCPNCNTFIGDNHTSGFTLRTYEPNYNSYNFCAVTCALNPNL